jgi:aminoglycoside phosphotransferase (APT) family kinase protein
MEGHPGFSTPKLYACLTDDDAIHYLIMERIEGETLHQMWDRLPFEEQKAIALQIMEQIRYLRSIPSEGYYGRVYRQAFDPDYPLLRLNNYNHETFGPYDTYKPYISALCEAAWLRAAAGTSAKQFPLRRRAAWLNTNLPCYRVRPVIPPLPTWTPHSRI